MKVIVQFFSLIVCLTLSLGCDGMGEKQRSLYGAQTLEDAQGAFYHTIAKYEIIETGEIIEFDFVTSCFNRDMVGSFSAVINPPNLFKATRDGGAIGIKLSGTYCSNLLRGRPLIHDKMIATAPHLAWYDDVNDLSVALVYATNDAYKSPLAKVRFVDFEITQANRAAFYEWQEKAEADYVQIGAIPGPFGCDEAYNLQPESCSSDQNQEKNKGRSIAFPTRRHGVWAKHVPDFKAIMEVAVPDLGNYYCRFSYDPLSENSMGNGPLELVEMRREYKKNSSDRSYNLYENWEHKDLYKTFSEGRQGLIRGQEYLLDVEALKGIDTGRNIVEYYPTVVYPYPSKEGREGTENLFGSDLSWKMSGIHQVLMLPEFRGFAIYSSRIPYRYQYAMNNPDIPKPWLSDPPNESLANVHIYIGEIPVCATREILSQNNEIFDFVDNKIIEYRSSF